MSKEALVFLLGLVVFIVPFIGIPRDLKEYVFIACGTMLMITGFLLRRAAFFRSIEKEPGERHTNEFIESMERSEQPSSDDDTEE